MKYIAERLMISSTPHAAVQVSPKSTTCKSHKSALTYVRPTEKSAPNVSMGDVMVENVDTGASPRSFHYR